MHRASSPSPLTRFPLEAERIPLLLGTLPVGQHVLLHDGALSVINHLAHTLNCVVYCARSALYALFRLIREQKPIGKVDGPRRKGGDGQRRPELPHSDHVPGPARRSTMRASSSSLLNSISILFLPRTFFTLTLVSRARRI